MSELALRERRRKQSWARPGGFHDRLIGILKFALPIAIGAFLAYLALVPLRQGDEISFILDKNKVDVASERMRVEAARYRGEDDKGRPFIIDARSAVQATSREPVVEVGDMAARIQLSEGPATLKAGKGRYNMLEERVAVVGPVVFEAAGGYRLETSDVDVDLNQQRMTSSGRVEGSIPLGRFSADRMTADLDGREVTLEGRTRLRIVQKGGR